MNVEAVATYSTGYCPDEKWFSDAQDGAVKAARKYELKVWQLRKASVKRTRTEDRKCGRSPNWRVFGSNELVISEYFY